MTTKLLFDDVALVVGNALAEIPRLEERPAAIVTSPPYADVREEVEAASPGEYVEWISPFLEALLAATDGSLLLNLGRVFRDGVEQGYIERTLLRAEEIGWKRIDTIIWGKINGRPINPYLTNVHEYVYWFVAGDPLSAYRGFDEVRYPYAPETLARYQRAWTNHASRKNSEDPRDTVVQAGREAHEGGSRPRSIYIAQVGKEKGILHPSPMALDLARFLVCLACPPGGLVLDPFGGSGTTAVAARLHGRRCVLIERDAAYAAEAELRLQQGALLFG